MNAGAKLAGFGLVLAAMVGGGAALGSAVGPIDVGDSAPRGGGHAPGEMTDCSTSPSTAAAPCHSAP